MTDPKRALFIVLGCLCVALGAVGAVLPGIPGTLFLLAAAWLFANSSPRLRERLLTSRLGAPLRRYEERRWMAARDKVTAIAAMWAGIVLAIWLLRGAGPALPVTVFLLGLTGTGVILFLVPGARSAPTRTPPQT